MFDDELVTIFDTISVNLFGAELSVAPVSAAAFGASALTGRIEFSGSFTGTLSATFGPALAARLAASMLEKPADQLSDGELRDVIGELVNIAAGNLKGVLPELCRLSLPSVHAGIPTPANQAAPLGRAMFKIFDEPVFVWLSQRGGSSALA
jgi:CheY-specific phosphatase CheX